MKIFHRNSAYFYFIFLVICLTLITAISFASCLTSLSERFPSQTTDLPSSAVIIALGHDSESQPLQNFADHVARQLKRKVVTYRHFSDEHLIAETQNWWERFPADEMTAIVEAVLRKSVSQCFKCRNIAFDLSHYEPKELFGPDGEKLVWSYTNFEVDLILRNRELFEATRWYKNNRELSRAEIDLIWAPVIAKLRSQKPLGYGP